MSGAFKIHAGDNVATLLADAEGGTAVAVRGEASGQVVAQEAVAHGHKIALADIAEGAAVVKFGIPIGVASQSIPAGGWVHLHNCPSSYDERSGGFDLETGAAGDMRYD